MSSDPFDESIIVSLRRAAQAVQAYEDQMHADLGLSPSAVRLLLNVRLSPGTSLTKLGRLVGLTSKSTEQLVLELESSGYLERRSHPDRVEVREIHVTDAGKRALEAATAIDDQVRDKVNALIGSQIEPLRAALNVISAIAPGS